MSPRRVLLGVPLALFFALAGGVPAAADATVFAPKSAPGRTTVIDVWCGVRATSASVNVVPFGGPPELPLVPYPAGGPGAFRVSDLIPAEAAPGRYDLVAECDDGLAGDATLVVGQSGGVPPAPGRTPERGRRAAALAASPRAIVATLAGSGFAPDADASVPASPPTGGLRRPTPLSRSR